MTTHLHQEWTVTVGLTGSVHVTADVRGHDDTKRALTFLAHVADLADAFLNGHEPTNVEVVEDSPAPSAGDYGKEVPAAHLSPADTSPPDPSRRAQRQTHRQVLLDTLADRGGSFEGAGVALARELEAKTGRMATALKQELTNMSREGLVLHEGRRHDGIWSLTGDGWRAAGRTPAAAPTTPPSRAAVPEPERPPLTVAGPIAHRPFDPERARMAAAAAL